MQKKSEIYFVAEKIKFELKGKNAIRKWIISTIENEKQLPGPLCYVFCSDNYLLGLNRKYLNHDYYTDIITFDYARATEAKSKKNVISGDLFISIDRVKDNARNSGTTFDNELKRVLIHGVLHLLGYTDKTPAAEKQMRKKENIYLKTFNLIKK